METTATSRAAPGNLKILSVAALLCAAAAASFLPLSSAVVSVMSLTCRRTAHERLCISLLAPDNRSGAAGTVQDLAVIALTVARNSTRDAVWLATELGLGARATAPTADRDLLAQCRALYAACFRGTTAAIALVAAARFGDAKGAAAALRGYPERCERLFYARGVKSPLQRTDTALQEELLASAEIVGLLR
ncbi:hypothetical protein U9M48_020488 [Paspalum notatum var. saurae]|uniref:Pectinesterase inhibitor domain-containing protein n=1 Tax=Paspalum notatum var. saurae TaxID=547442 RepID=A0AAQ3WSP8_PASNO